MRSVVGTLTLAPSARPGVVCCFLHGAYVHVWRRGYPIGSTTVHCKCEWACRLDVGCMAQLALVTKRSSVVANDTIKTATTVVLGRSTLVDKLVQLAFV